MRSEDSRGSCAHSLRLSCCSSGVVHRLPQCPCSEREVRKEPQRLRAKAEEEREVDRTARSPIALAQAGRLSSLSLSEPTGRSSAAIRTRLTTHMSSLPPTAVVVRCRQVRPGSCRQSPGHQTGSQRRVVCSVREAQRGQREAAALPDSRRRPAAPAAERQQLLQSRVEVEHGRAAGPHCAALVWPSPLLSAAAAAALLQCETQHVVARQAAVNALQQPPVLRPTRPV